MANKTNNFLNFAKKMAIIVVLIILCAIEINNLITNNKQEQTNNTPTSTSNTNIDELVWDETIAPNYYVITGPADFENESLNVKEGTYELWQDDLGRPSLVTGNINYSMRKDGAERDRNNLPNPLGWPKNKQVEITFADGTIYHGWLFNRSHLLAKSLGGPDTKQNLVTGTRTQNVGNNNEDGGMGHTETEAREWLDKNKDGTILYEVEPLYVNNDPIPRAVAVDIKTSDGTIDEHCITYNYAKGFDIDYATGEWKEAA